MGAPLSPLEIQNAEAARIAQAQAAYKAPPFYRSPEPVSSETETVTPAEASPVQMDQIAEERKEDGFSFPMPQIRPAPPGSIREEGSVIVAKELAGQLATSPEIKSQYRIDERKLAVFPSARIIASVQHFSYRFTYDKVRYHGHVCDWYLTGTQGINGLARRHILAAMSAITGTQTVEKAEKPNAIARNLWKRNWKQQAEAEGKIVEE